jgi:large subunit ribosomal protein L24
MRHVRKNDIVMVIKGIEKGKTGKVLSVSPEKKTVIVEGLMLRKKAIRKSPDRPHGGFITVEQPISISNVLPYCPNCKKGVRVKRIVVDGKKVRKCKKCDYVFA